MENGQESAISEKPQVNPGMLPAWGVKDMPEPPPFRLRNVMLVVGPGAIALCLSMGSGEWVAGPAATVKYGVGLLWITLLAVIFQATLNMESSRYTLATGEPIFTGFMRTWPGPIVWGSVYIILAVLNIGWPGWAKGSATALFAVIWGYIPGDDAETIISLLGMATFLATIIIVLFGGRIERTLEVISIFMILFIFGYLFFLCIYFATPALWGKTFLGFFRFGHIPQTENGLNWNIITLFAVFSGAGGIGNLWISNWIRDKGFGMGKTVGFIPTIISGKKVNVPQVGNRFDLNDANVSRWKTWWKYLTVDQGVLFGLGCILGMFLPVLAVTAVIPLGTDMTGNKVGCIQAQFFAEQGGAALWFLTLFVGFWALFGTQLAIVDGFTRTVTDILWSGSTRVRSWFRNDIRYAYYGILFLFAGWGCCAIWIDNAFRLLTYGALFGAVIFVIAGIHVLVVQWKFLPRGIRAPIWRQALVVLCVVFYATILVLLIIYVYSK
ncbi:MAG: Nramp family divalent metal transporter [Planctomycetota bacterium]